jgi:N-acetylneuraminic acid mutarotase
VAGSYPDRQMPVPRRGHSCTLVRGTELHVFGGSGPEPVKGRDRYFNEMWILDIKTLMWTKVKTAGAAPPPRAQHSATLVNEEIYVVGGTCDKEFYSDVWCFNTHTKVWTCLEISNKGPLPLHAHCAHKHPWYNNRIYFLGGKHGTSNICEDVHSLLAYLSFIYMNTPYYI